MLLVCGPTLRTTSVDTFTHLTNTGQCAWGPKEFSDRSIHYSGTQMAHWIQCHRENQVEAGTGVGCYSMWVLQAGDSGAQRGEGWGTEPWAGRAGRGRAQPSTHSVPDSGGGREFQAEGTGCTGTWEQRDGGNAQRVCNIPMRSSQIWGIVGSL